VRARPLVVLLGLAAAVLVAAALVVLMTERQRFAVMQAEIQTLQNRVRALSFNTASGGGVNVKLMPDPATGKPTVPLEEVFSFDRNHAICRVDTNPRAFKMPTYKMGEVVIQPHQFFMAMQATTIDKFEVTTLPNGRKQVTMRGGLSCATEVGQTKVRIGSRTAKEHATYLIEATDGGGGGGKAGDSFAFTVFFDEKEAPVNYSIFGPKATFTGQMIEGEITIVDPKK
jgi:hypothetical protein